MVNGTISQIHHLITLDMRNLYIRIHRDITGEMWFGVGATVIIIPGEDLRI